MRRSCSSVLLPLFLVVSALQVGCAFQPTTRATHRRPLVLRQGPHNGHSFRLNASNDRFDGADWQRQRSRSRDNNNKSRTSQRRNGGRGGGRGGRGSQTSRRPRRREEHMPFENAHSYYLTTCLPGMAEILQEELQSLGCVEVTLSGKSAVSFGVSNLQTILEVLLWTRTAHKIMELLINSNEPVHTREDLYNFIRSSTPVSDLLANPATNDDWLTLSVSVTLNNAKFIPPDINHSHYTALNVKNALVDEARDLSGTRPNVDTEDADVPLTVVLRGIPSEARFYGTTTNNKNNSNQQPEAAAVSNSAGARVSLYRGIHTGSLHRRGYRSGAAVHKAAMKESTAAGLLLSTGWADQCRGGSRSDNGDSGGATLVDPMMGSGTFLLEGAMIAADLAPGLMRLKCGVPASRNPPIVRWNHGDSDSMSWTTEEDVHTLWNSLLQDAADRTRKGLASIKERNVRILGNDLHGGALDLAEHAIRQAGLASVVQVNEGNCLDWHAVTGGTSSESASPELWTVVSNPPWGVRLTEEISESWEALRVFLRERSPAGTTAWILSGSADATKHLGLRRSASLPLQSGQQDLRWLQYTIRDKSAPPPVEKKVTRYAYKEERRAMEDSISIQSNGASTIRTLDRKESTKSSTRVENDWLI